MDFTKDDLRVFNAFLNQQSAQGKRFDTDGRRLDGGMYLSRVATWEQDERGVDFVATHDLGSRNAQQIHSKLRKMGGGIVHEGVTEGTQMKTTSNKGRRLGLRAEAKRGGAPRKYYVVEQVQNGLWCQVGHFYSKSDAERFASDIPGKTRIVHTFPSTHDYPVVGEEARSRLVNPTEARRGHVEAIHGYDIEIVFSDERFARKHESEVGSILQLPFIKQYAGRDYYALVYGPIERDDYRRLEGLIHRRLGNAARVRLVQNMYAGSHGTDEARPTRSAHRPPRRR